MCDVAFSYYANKDTDFNYVEIDVYCEFLQRVIISLESLQALDWVWMCLREGIYALDLHSYDFPRQVITSSFIVLASQLLIPRLCQLTPLRSITDFTVLYVCLNTLV